MDFPWIYIYNIYIYVHILYVSIYTHIYIYIYTYMHRFTPYKDMPIHAEMDQDNAVSSMFLLPTTSLQTRMQKYKTADALACAGKMCDDLFDLQAPDLVLSWSKDSLLWDVSHFWHFVEAQAAR